MIGALLLLGSEGHVSMIYKAGQPGPIRNANSATGNGGASVAGPCGGSNAFGANGVGQLQDEDTVTLNINYAAGHRSQQNYFRFAYSCGATNQNALAAQGAMLTAAANECTSVTAGTPSTYDDAAGGVHAPDAIVQGGYDITCKLPAQGNTEPLQCTLSLLDQRDWGGCVDVDLIPAAAALPPAPPPTPYVSSEGKYYLVAANAIDSSAATFTNCNFDGGFLDVPAHPQGATSFTATLSATAEGCRASADTTAPPTMEIVLDETFAMIADADVPNKYCGTVLVDVGAGVTATQQPYVFCVSQGSVDWAYFNPDNPDEQPVINDGFSALGLNPAGSDGGGSSSAAVIAVVVILLLVLLGVGCYIWYRRRGTANQSKVPEWTGGYGAKYTNSTTPPPPPPPATSPLPAGWVEMRDANTGQSYYHNAALQQTQWERPLGHSFSGKV